MLLVGLTGGYATGKTFVAGEMARLGCHVIYADKLGHQVLEAGGEAYTPVVALFGRAILDANGAIDRKALGAVVFDAPAKLEELSAIVHPAVYRLEDQLLRRFADADPYGVAVVEAAILIEKNSHVKYDQLVLTNCDRETQIRRGMHRDGLTREEVERRLDAQLPFEQKRKWANYVIETSGTKEETARQVEEVVNDLMRQARRA